MRWRTASGSVRRSGCRSRNSLTGTFSPRRQQSQCASSSAVRDGPAGAAGAAGGFSGSVMVGLLQAQLAGRALQGAVQPLAQRLGDLPQRLGAFAFPHLRGDVGPLAAGGALLPQPQLLRGQAAAELLQQVLVADLLAGGRPRGGDAPLLRAARLDAPVVALVPQLVAHQVDDLVADHLLEQLQELRGVGQVVLALAGAGEEAFPEGLLDVQRVEDLPEACVDQPD